eukprot:6191373-Pleurochrysis_carterae.AAC.1
MDSGSKQGIRATRPLAAEARTQLFEGDIGDPAGRAGVAGELGWFQALEAKRVLERVEAGCKARRCTRAKNEGNQLADSRDEGSRRELGEEAPATAESLLSLAT